MKTFIKYTLVAFMLSLTNVAYADKVCQKLTLAGNKIKQKISIVPSTAACPKGATEIINTATLTSAPGIPGIPGPQGPQGTQGPAGGFLPTLPSSQLMKGVYGVVITATAAGEYFTDTQTFPYSLPSDLIANPHYIKNGDPTISVCPGTVAAPDALPGHLCLFEKAGLNRSTNNIVIFDTVTGNTDITNWRLGFGIGSVSSQAGNVAMYGTFAVRAR